jgi:uncharacterized membrane protein (UPF0136 family)
MATQASIETAPCRRGGNASIVGGAVLGAILLGWCALMLAAPEIGSLVAVFGSPALALFIIVRLLAPDGSPRRRSRDSK